MEEFDWIPIDSFASPGEFSRLEKWLEVQREHGRAEEVQPKAGPGSLYWKQRWIRHVSSGEVWVLAYPDPPFRGEFKKVESDVTAQ